MAQLYKQKTSSNWWIDLQSWDQEKGKMVRTRISSGTTDEAKARKFSEGLEAASKAAKELAGKSITKKHAEAILTNLLTIAGIEITGAKPLPELREFMEDFLKWRSPRVSAGSMRTYRGSHAKVKEWLEVAKAPSNAKIDWVTADRVEELYEWLRSRLAVKTANEHLKYFGRVMKRAVEKTDLLKNPVDGLEMEKGGTSLDRLPFSLAEAKQIFQYLEKHKGRKREWARAVALALMSGCRLEDALTMDQGNIKDGILSYRQKKTGKTITCPMVVPEWLKVIKETNTGPVCPELNAEFLQWKTAKVSNEFTKLVIEAGVDQKYQEFKSGRTIARKTFHSLRHTLRTAIINSGGSDAQADVILGHSEGQGKRYTHAEVDAMELTLSRALSPP